MMDCMLMPIFGFATNKAFMREFFSDTLFKSFVEFLAIWSKAYSSLPLRMPLTLKSF